MPETKDRTLVPFISQQVPDFIRSDHQLFVDFLEAYFEWLQLSGNYYHGARGIIEQRDIDKTLDEFVDQFKKEFLESIPDNIQADKRKLVKRIRQFYSAKGTQKSYKLLFRILFNEDVDFFFPKEDILRTSHGKWQVDNVLRTTSTTDTFKFKNREIKGLTSGATAAVEDVIQFQDGENFISEIFISNILGSFQIGENVEVVVDGTPFQETTKGMVVGATITDPGQGYKVGDEIAVGTGGGGKNALLSVKTTTGEDCGKAEGATFLVPEDPIPPSSPEVPASITLQTTGSFKASDTDDFYNGLDILISRGPGAGQTRTIVDYNGTTKVAFVDSDWDTLPTTESRYIIFLGQIQSVDVKDFGFDYVSVPTLDFSKNGLDPSNQASGTALIGAVGSAPGRWVNTDGFLNQKVLQDSFFYQEFSYVLRAKQSINTYRDIVKRTIHPSGLILFGEVDIETSLKIGPTWGNAFEKHKYFYPPYRHFWDEQSLIGQGSGAKGIAVLAAGAVDSITIQDGGSGYSVPPFVEFRNGGGSGAKGTVVLTNDEVSSVVIDNGGSGYTSPPEISFIIGGRGAKATANIVGGAVDSFTVSDVGAGYISPPTVKISGDGSGAAGTAVLTNGVVSSITVDQGGSGYTSATVKLIRERNDPPTPIYGFDQVYPTPNQDYWDKWTDPGNTTLEAIKDVQLNTIINQPDSDIDLLPDSFIGIRKFVNEVPVSNLIAEYDMVEGADPQVLFDVSAVGETFNGFLGSSSSPDDDDPSFTTEGQAFNGIGAHDDLSITPVSPLAQTVMVVFKSSSLTSSLRQSVIGSIDADSDDRTGYQITIENDGRLTFRVLKIDINDDRHELTAQFPAGTIKANTWYVATLRYKNNQVVANINSDSIGVSASFTSNVEGIGIQNNSSGWVIGNQGKLPPAIGDAFWGSSIWRRTLWALQFVQVFSDETKDAQWGENEYAETHYGGTKTTSTIVFDSGTVGDFFFGSVGYAILWNDFISDDLWIQTYFFLKNVMSSRGVSLP